MAIFSRSNIEQPKNILLILTHFPEMDTLYLNPITGDMETQKENRRRLLFTRIYDRYIKCSFLHKKYQAADPNRIGMWGHSMGGMITLRTMVTTSDIKAGVIWAGVVASYEDLTNNWHHPDLNPRPFVFSEREQAARRPGRQSYIDKYGTFQQNPSLLAISFTHIICERYFGSHPTPTWYGGWRSTVLI